jgi:TetR/AcrR family transcriptional repressor of nem operon
MGRKLEFCKDKALEQAMDSFWRRGYTSTSMRDLAENLGLHLGSVYNALGGKESVFESSLKLYFERHIEPHLQEMRTSADCRQAVVNYVNRAYEDCTTRSSSAPGCFLVNSVLSITEINETITKEVHDHLHRVEVALVECIERGRKAGQFPKISDAKQCAHGIMAACTAIWVMKKYGMNDAFLADIRDGAVKSLEG